MTVYHIPKAISDRYRPAPDPRDPPVAARDEYPQTPETTRAALTETNRERAAIGLDPLEPVPHSAIPSPIYVDALREGICAACGASVPLHFDTSGFYYVGCQGVPARQELNRLTSLPLTHATEWGDPFPSVSSAIRDVLLAGAGPDVSYFYNTLTADERLNLSRRLARLAVVAFRASEAGK